MVAANVTPRLPDDLRAAFEEAGEVLILSHDNPDPDALASAFVLEVVLRAIVEAEVTVGYAGIIGRAENRAMIHELDLAPVALDGLELAQFDAIALVDTQPGFGNNSLPADALPAAVIDHHPLNKPLRDVAFVDVREEYGVTSTIVAEYAKACGVALSEKLVTALFYALKSETQELGRDSTDADRVVYMELFPDADKEALARIQRARVPRDYFHAFRSAIESAELFGHTVVSDLRRVDSPDLVAEIADFLLRLEGADWACCLGRQRPARGRAARCFFVVGAWQVVPRPCPQDPNAKYL